MSIRKSTKVLAVILLICAMVIGNAMSVFAATVTKTRADSSAYSVKATVTYTKTAVSTTRNCYVLQGSGKLTSSMGSQGVMLIDARLVYRLNNRGTVVDSPPYNNSAAKWDGDNEGPWTAYYQVDAVQPIGGRCELYTGRSSNSLSIKPYVAAEY